MGDIVVNAKNLIGLFHLLVEVEKILPVSNFYNDEIVEIVLSQLTALLIDEGYEDELR